METANAMMDLRMKSVQNPLAKRIVLEMENAQMANVIAIQDSQEMLVKVRHVQMVVDRVNVKMAIVFVQLDSMEANVSSKNA